MRAAHSSSVWPNGSRRLLLTGATIVPRVARRSPLESTSALAVDAISLDGFDLGSTGNSSATDSSAQRAGNHCDAGRRIQTSTSTVDERA